MATTEYGVNHPLAVKAWSRKLFQEALAQCWFSKFIGTGSDSIVQRKTEISKGPGDKITFGLRMQLSGAGVSGDSALEGNEEALTTYSDAVLIDQLRHAVRTAGKMSEQRVPFSIREEARQGLTDWLADRIDTAIINQLAGNTGQADTRYTGSNATVAPTSTADANGITRILFGGDATANTTEGSISTTETFRLNYIDRCVNRAKAAKPLIRPVKVQGDDYYVMFLHPHKNWTSVIVEKNRAGPKGRARLSSELQFYRFASYEEPAPTLDEPPPAPKRRRYGARADTAAIASGSDR